MMKSKKNSWSRSIFSWAGLMASVVGLGACIRALPYQEVLKENVISKSAVDFSAEYLYVPSVGGISRTATGTLPFMLGEEKIVKLELTRDFLQAYELERDVNFKGNPQNRRLVFEIPISHVEYRCQEDRLGNCRNQEEENSSIDWYKKSQFKPDFSRVKITEPNFLPESISKLIISGTPCMVETSSKPLEYEFGEKHINFRIERTMANNINCGFFEYLSDFTVSVVSNYNLVKLDSISSEGYKKVNYPAEDEGRFAFFQTNYRYADVDNGYRQNREVRLLNRWSPDRKEVVYYLSDEFNKPENKLLKEAAYRTIARANGGLEEAGIRFRLRLNEPAGVNPGDMRNNLIILQEDVDGLVGYSPFVVHPLTGEILAGRAVIFSGALKQHAWQTYEQIREQIAEEMAPKAPDKSSDKGADAKSQPSAHENKSGSSELKQADVKFDDDFLKALTERRENFGSFVPKDKVSLKNISLKDYLDSKLGIETPDAYPVDQLMAQRHFCLLEAQPGIGGFVNPEIVKAIKEKFGSGELKAWEDLSATEKQFVLDLIMPEEFASTLIHELGHNLGLRHNFRGSEDKDNFYTKRQMAKRGLSYTVDSSSVMDYLEGLQGLPIFGKYDIAALRFGYQRQVEKEGGDLIQLEGTLSEKISSPQGGLKPPKLKEYKSCTESGLSGAICKRFDAGTTYVEIADSIIRRYKRIVSWYGQRHKRANFSGVVDEERIRYILSIYRTFYELRSFMEAVDEVNEYLVKFNNGDAKAVKEIIWRNSQNRPRLATIVNMYQAAVNVGRFFLEVLTTPERTCLIGKKDGLPEQIPMTRRLIELDSEALSCSQVKLAEDQVLLGEVGRFLFDKEEKTRNKEDLTFNRFGQIVVRGSWLDKILAVKFLATRRINEEGGFHLYDRITGSYLDDLFGATDDEKAKGISGLKEELTQVFRGIMLNKQAVLLRQVRLADGRNVDLKIPLNVLETHTIPRQLFTGLAYFLHLPVEREANLIEILGQQMVRQTKFLDLIHRDAALGDLNRVGVYRTTDVFGKPTEAGMSSFVVGKTKYLATESNEIASVLIFRVDGGADKLIGEALTHLYDKNKYSKFGVRAFLREIDNARTKKGSPGDAALLPIQQKIADLPNSFYAEVRDPLSDMSDFSLSVKEVLEKRAFENKRDVSRILKMLPALDNSSQ